MVRLLKHRDDCIVVRGAKAGGHPQGMPA